MDTESLRALLAVADTGSFSKAAEELHLTQPAISKRIAQLEQQLGTRLFDRIGRHIALTQAGRLLHTRAEGILRALDDAERAIHDLSGHIGGHLPLATSHHIGLHRLPPVLRAFSERHPAVKLDIDFMDSEAAHGGILHGQLELAVVTLAPDMPAALCAEPIWSDPLSVMVAHSHPLAAQRQSTLEELSRYPAVLPGENTYTGQIVLGMFERAGLPVEVSLHTNYLEIIRMMVSVGLGWSVLPRSMLGRDLQALALPGAVMQRQLGAIWHRNRSLSNAARAFLDCLRQSASEPINANRPRDQ